MVPAVSFSLYICIAVKIQKRLPLAKERKLKYPVFISSCSLSSLPTVTKKGNTLSDYFLSENTQNFRAIVFCRSKSNNFIIEHDGFVAQESQGFNKFAILMTS